MEGVDEGKLCVVTYLRNYAHVGESRMLLRMVRAKDREKGWEYLGDERNGGI